VLESQGILPRQHITFLCDGGDTVRELGAFVHPRSEHILDWFHVAMRIEQLLQSARGLQGPEKEESLKGIERVKWFLWHGNVIRADETLYDLLEDIADVHDRTRQAGLTSTTMPTPSSTTGRGTDAGNGSPPALSSPRSTR
jgi:hypothetical protein